jgi:hypothetical protein
MYVALSSYQMSTQHASLQTFRRKINGDMFISHPNVLPIIDVSETPFQFYMMSPWMPDGNITQYTQVNPNTNRLVLVCGH